MEYILVGKTFSERVFTIFLIGKGREEKGFIVVGPCIF